MIWNTTLCKLNEVSKGLSMNVKSAEEQPRSQGPPSPVVRHYDSITMFILGRKTEKLMS